LTQVLCRERKCCRLREVGHEIFVGHLPRQSNHCQLKSLLLQHNGVASESRSSSLRAAAAFRALNRSRPSLALQGSFDQSYSRLRSPISDLEQQSRLTTQRGYRQRLGSPGAVGSTSERRAARLPSTPLFRFFRMAHDDPSTSCSKTHRYSSRTSSEALPSCANSVTPNPAPSAS